MIKRFLTLLISVMPVAAMAQMADDTFTFGNMSAMLVVLFFFALMVVALLLIFRELICWYFKINQVVGMQEEIKTLLKELKEEKSKLK